LHEDHHGGGGYSMPQQAHESLPHKGGAGEAHTGINRTSNLLIQEEDPKRNNIELNFGLEEPIVLL
jgi:hypothetical protein